MTQLPLRKMPRGDQIETRPMYVEEWLDSLPYIDFNKTAALLEQALAATNKEDIKGSTRAELNKLYHRPYQYYLESQIKTGAQHTLQTIGAMQGQVTIMKQIAVHLAYSCKQAFDKSLMHKSLWKRTKPPYEALLMSLNYLSHALIFSYLEYSPVPKNIWKQLNFIYNVAESGQCQKTLFTIPGPTNNHAKTTFEHAYKRILMASLVDPHHLPFGAIWEIYEQLDDWAIYAELKSMQTVADANGYFVLDLRSDKKPIPYSKFNIEKASKTTRLLDASQLEKLIKKQLDRLQLAQPLDSSIKLSPFYAKSLMAHMLSVWGLPPSRHSQRRASKGELKVYSDIESVYYFLNDNTPFTPPASTPDENEIDISDVPLQHDQAKTRQYKNEQWRIVDQSAGGYALIRSEKPDKSIRVGQLVAIESDTNSGKRTLGFIRWLMISRQVHKVGIEKISSLARPIAIRAREGSLADREYRAAFLITYKDEANKLSIVAEKGLYIHMRDLEIIVDGKQKLITAEQLIESGVTCEIFSFSQS